jgi:hypothetical protein
LGWVKTECTWYVGHHLTQCTTPDDG